MLLLPKPVRYRRWPAMLLLSLMVLKRVKIVTSPASTIDCAESPEVDSLKGEFAE